MTDDLKDLIPDIYYIVKIENDKLYGLRSINKERTTYEWDEVIWKPFVGLKDLQIACERWFKRKDYMIITEDKNLIKNIIKDNGAYRSIKAATKKVYQIYMSKLINNESVGQRLINNEQLEAEIIEMIHYDYGDTEISVDSIARKYIEKYARE